jgi:acyl-[acyl-carrier-protein]-phospholipid O-acyltransferase / long-chain-fatty-acid--[acyl-carrier-protein] ligase
LDIYMKNDFDLLKTRRFFPLFLTQFLGAFNDNFFKNALVILLTFQTLKFPFVSSELAVTFAAGLFILPFFLFSSLAGQLADKYERSRLIFYVKLWEVALMILASWGFMSQNFSLLLVVLFFLGTQAAFFGPLKYAILPDHLLQTELIAGNGFIEAGTFLAILCGTIFGGTLILGYYGWLIVSVLALLISIIGCISSLYIPQSSAPSKKLKINWNIFQSTYAIVTEAFSRWDIYILIMGISWFWLVGAVYLAEFSIFAKNILHSNASVITFFFTIFSLGIGLGSLSCQKLLKQRIEATYVPLGAFIMAIFSMDLYFSSQHSLPQIADHYMTLVGFLSHWNSWRITFDLLFIALGGGIYIVPLYAILQNRSISEERARMIAANNIINALFMVLGAIISGIILALHFSVTTLFLILAIGNFFVTVYICKLLPDALVKSFVKWLLKSLYRVEVKGLEHYEAAGERVVIIANHSSFLDAALISAFLPDKLSFAVSTFVARQWWLKLLMHFIDTFPVNPSHAFSMKSLIRHVEKNHRCVIFPEGRITVTGALMKIYEGPGLVADKAKANLLPIRIEGAQYTPFSRLKGKVRIRWFPKITLTISEPVVFNIPQEIKGRNRRQYIGRELYRLMVDMLFISSPYQTTLTHALLDAVTIHGRKHQILEDIERKPISYQQLLMKSFILGRYTAQYTSFRENVGILLPNSIACVVTFFGLHFFGRVPAILNFSTGARNVGLACQTAKLKRVYTSRRFVETAKLEDMVKHITQQQVEVIYLEDLRSEISISLKLRGLMNSVFPEWVYQRNMKKETGLSSELSENPAVILFTSGSEGTPKGVVLSHQNLLANCYQIRACVDFTAQDIAFNALPLFHSFGLTAGFILPILNGIKIFLYPSPLHYRVIPELVYDTNATIFYSTDTFLTGYAKYAHSYDFYRIRYVFTGAEKLKAETRRIWMEKFGVNLFEGYGATEASPVISTNTPMQNIMGTVGRFLPGIEYRLESIPGLSEGQRLWVKGPNIMSGYLLNEKPGVLQSPIEGWYDTGDIVGIDENGFIKIFGRAKRFAKIGGEMVSLTAVETFLQESFPNYQNAVISIPDEKKGEQLLLYTTHQTLTREKVLEKARENGIPEIALPKKIKVIDEIPVLGSGKVDYIKLSQL